ncbi:putative disease resistance protein RGA4, partial [Mucuna pruriens]
MNSGKRTLTIKKRYLVILDDVWNDKPDNWYKLERVLACEAKGASILVTTSLPKVAAIMVTVPPHELSILSDDDDWKLFKHQAFAPNEEEQVACGHRNRKGDSKEVWGVPLAAKALGALLRFKRKKNEWLYVKENNLWNVEDIKLASSDSYFVGKERGFLLEELGSLKLKESHHITRLERVKSVMDAREANMLSKQLNQLWLSWNINEESELQEEILEAIQPNNTQQLQSLTVTGYKGSHFPQWMSSSPSLKCLKLKNCKNCLQLPALGKLPSLKDLRMSGMITTSALEITQCPKFWQRKCFKGKLVNNNIRSVFARVPRHVTAPALAISKRKNKNGEAAAKELSYNPIGPDGAKALAELLNFLGNIKTLKLGWCQIGGAKGAEFIADALKYNTSISILDLQANGLRDEGAQCLARSLKVEIISSLMSRLSDSLDDGAFAIAQALESNDDVVVIMLPASTVSII